MIATETYRPRITSSSPPFEQDFPKEQSIFDFYSINNEIDFVRTTDIPIEEKRFYVRENVTRFLGEFAGRVPYTKISYVARPEGFYFGDMKIGESYERTARMAGSGSREEAEHKGFTHIEQGLNDGQTATWISPSKVADYGFVFHFERQGDKISEYILRYPEPLFCVDVSRTISSRLGRNPETEGFTKANEFVASPWISNLTHEQVMQALDIDTHDIMASRRFEDTVEHELGGLIDQYVEGVVSGADTLKLEILLAGIFNRSQAIQKELSRGRYVHTVDSSKSIEHLMHFALQRGERIETTIIGGGSCPVTRGKQSSGLLSNADILSNLKAGVSFSETKTDYKNDPRLCRCGQAQGAHFHCPGEEGACKHPIVVGKGITQCPSCGQGKTC